MKKILFGIFILTFIFLVSYSSAWGVASVYTRNNPITLVPNASATVIYSLQNKVGGEDLRIFANVTGGTEYAKIVGPNEYDLPLGSGDIKVNVEVTAPSEEGEYLIIIEFSTITLGTGGGVVMGTGIDKGLTLISSKGLPPEEEIEKVGIPIYAWIIVAVIAVAIILWFILKPKKKKRRR